METSYIPWKSNPSPAMSDNHHPVLGDSEPQFPYKPQIGDTFVDETQCFTVTLAEKNIPQADIMAIPSSPTRRPRFQHRMTRSLAPRQIRLGCRKFVDAQGSPGVADTYESDEEDGLDILEDDATFSTPQPRREIEPTESSSQLFVYELNGVPIDLSEVHPSMQKLLLGQYRSGEHGKLPPKALIEMWKVIFHV